MYKKLIFGFVTLCVLLGCVYIASASYTTYTGITSPTIISPEVNETLFLNYDFPFACNSSIDNDYDTITCKTVKDALTYTWSASGGVFFDGDYTGLHVYWKPTTTTADTVRVTVSDDSSETVYANDSDVYSERNFTVIEGTPGIIFVDEDATGDNTGTSWENAFNDIEDAFLAVGDLESIWVAEGTYTLTSQLTLDVTAKVYGGFDPTVGDDTLEERDPSGNVTIIDGDNSYRGIYTTSICMIDGFTITNCNASGYGGAIYAIASEPKIQNCVIKDNTAFDGGGIAVNSDSVARIANCLIVGNTASDDNGGGIFISTSDAIIINSLIVGNDTSATGAGGGIYLTATEDVDILNCTISDNSANTGGGISAYTDNSDVRVANTILWADNSTTSGREEYENTTVSSSTPSVVTFVNSDIEGGWNGSGVFNNSSLSCQSNDDGVNINSDPNFSDISDVDGIDNKYFTDDDGYKITTNSPCKDSGDDNALPYYVFSDVTWVYAREQDDMVDIGAYEYGTQAVNAVQDPDRVNVLSFTIIDESYGQGYLPHPDFENHEALYPVHKADYELYAGRTLARKKIDVLTVIWHPGGGVIDVSALIPDGQNTPFCILRVKRWPGNLNDQIESFEMMRSDDMIIGWPGEMEKTIDYMVVSVDDSGSTNKVDVWPLAADYTNFITAIETEQDYNIQEVYPTSWSSPDFDYPHEQWYLQLKTQLENLVTDENLLL